MKIEKKTKRIFITGDTHGDFRRIVTFCEQYKTKREDVLIILGDSGINYYGKIKDRVLKNWLKNLSITLFCIHGNRENRPENISSYQLIKKYQGLVYQEKQYPNLLFAKDGEVYNFNGKKALVIGGAYSLDKFYRISCGHNWWSDEQPSNEIKVKISQKVYELGYLDYVLTHTCPLKFEPKEKINCIKFLEIDKTTEEWLDRMEDLISYGRWYCGHFHTEKRVKNINFMFENFAQLK